MEEKNLAEWSLEELKAEEKKLRKSEILSAGLIGFLVGVLIYGVVKNGFGFLHIALPLLLIFWIHKDSKGVSRQLRQIRTEIKAKDSAPA